MQFGISTACLYPEETMPALEALLADGHRIFEVFFNTYSELRPRSLNAMVSLLERYNARIDAIHPFTSGYEGILLFSDYTPRNRDGLLFYRHYFKAAKTLGAKYLILHGLYNKYCNEVTAKRYMENYRILYETGLEYGIEVLQENVNLFLSQSPSFIHRMHEELGDSCGFCFDNKQAYRAGVSPLDMLAAMGSRLKHVHLSDHRGEESCILPGDGVVDFAQLHHAIAKTGFDGDVILEVYRTSFTTRKELTQGVACLQQRFQEETQLAKEDTL